MGTQTASKSADEDSVAVRTVIFLAAMSDMFLLWTEGVQYCTVLYSTVQYCTVDLDTMHQLHHQTMPKVLLHSAGHCEHKNT